ncbi:hypothetical protein B0H17DRAFT_1185830 [Mycena rosella]|uniref:Uncharacterized protein n=1 Tax=Mycena rosella TaxID=1033263 RepID=A0AAD7CPR0_MYCRO|nr:hypothetical protein B0H17DRAFT_1185830 [Mycena rosella]
MPLESGRQRAVVLIQAGATFVLKSGGFCCAAAALGWQILRLRRAIRGGVSWQEEKSDGHVTPPSQDIALPSQALAEERLHESIRVEWARARARKVRWCEEVMLLREEMRRVLRYLNWQADWWRGRVDLRKEFESGAVAAGARAYALKQARWHDRLGGFFRIKWTASALSTAGSLVAWETVDTVEDLDEFFCQQ